jgi:hypothetical protein
MNMQWHLDEAWVAGPVVGSGSTHGKKRPRSGCFWPERRGGAAVHG